MPRTTCPVCGSATPDGLACTDCTDRLRGELIGRWEWSAKHSCRQFTDGIAQLWPRLVETITRQDRTGVASEIHVHDPGAKIPFAIEAADVGDTVRATLVGWCRVAHEDLGVDWPRDTVPAMCARLAGTDWRGHEAVADVSREIHGLHTSIMRVIDLPADKARITVGPCPEDECAGDLVAVIRDDEMIPSVVTCTDCGTVSAMDRMSTVEDLGRRVAARRERLARQEQLARQIIGAA